MSCTASLRPALLLFLLTLALTFGCSNEPRLSAGSAALAECDDGNPCTSDIAVCPPGAPLPCENPQCLHAPYGAPPGYPHPFDDDNPCTIDLCDAVEGITHVPAPGATCDTDGDICSGIGICDTTGHCIVGPALPDGSECDDGDICNGVDTCQAGACQTAAPAPAGTDCWDGMNGCVSAACDGQGACIQTALQGHLCDDGSPCTAEDQCDASGQCVGTPLADGDPCADGDACNGAEACNAGACIPGTPISADDGNPQTLDTCDPATGTVHHADCSAILDLTVTTTLDVAARCLHEGPAPLQVAHDGIVHANGVHPIVSVVSYDASLLVHNLSVSKSHSYGVSAAGLLVHNKAALARGAPLAAGKNFKDHFVAHRALVEKALGVKFGKFKEGGGEALLKALGEAIDDGTFAYVGQGTLKKGAEIMHIYRGRGVTIVTSSNGEWVTALRAGQGLDLAIQMVP